MKTTAVPRHDLRHGTVAAALDTVGTAAPPPSPRDLGFVYKWLSPTFCIHAMDGRKANEFPLLRDTALLDANCPCF